MRKSVVWLWIGGVISLLLLVGSKGEEVVLEEAMTMEEGKSADLWLSSGGKVFIDENQARTIQGDLDSFDYWRMKYGFTKPVDTNKGYNPQNIFRLVTRSKWDDFWQEAHFRVVRDNPSESERKNQANGLLFLQRYQDANNLYYAGIRVDGQAVIKKKVSGVYYTLAEEKVFPGRYDVEDQSNLLPEGEWIGLRSEVKTSEDGTVLLRLFMDKDGEWVKIVEATDWPGRFGFPVFGKGYGGIRTDFMDVEFKGYKLGKLR